MQTLFQITNKKQLQEELEERIIDFCNDSLEMKLSLPSFRSDMNSHIEQNLADHNLDSKKFSTIEGTFLFHNVFSKMMPQVYAQWYEVEREVFDEGNFFVENNDTVEALQEANDFYKGWKVELTEPLLVQELKRALQYRLFEIRDNLNLTLLNDCDITHIEADENENLSEELLELLKEVAKTENQIFDLISKIESISL